MARPDVVPPDPHGLRGAATPRRGAWSVGAGVETRIDLEELAARAAEFETAPAGKVMRWAVERFGGDLTLACSFQDCVIIDLAVEVDPGIEVLFLDTGFHFPETLAYRRGASGPATT